MPALGQDRLRVELHAVDRQLGVPHRHDHPAAGARGDLQDLGQRLRQDRQRVVAGRGERVWKALQDTDIRVEYAAGLAVQQLGGTIDGGAERDADGLVAQADPQQRRVRAAQARTRLIDAPARSGSTRTRAEEDTVELRGGR